MSGRRAARPLTVSAGATTPRAVGCVVELTGRGAGMTVVVSVGDRRYTLSWHRRLDPAQKAALDRWRATVAATQAERNDRGGDW